MTQLYLVRHGETAWSRERRHTSVTDLDLTETGVVQAQALRGRLNTEQFGRVLCSPRLRARHTAELAGFDPTRLEITEDLAEWAYGSYEGLTAAEIRAQDPGWTIWTGTTPGGETPDQVRRRLGRLVEAVQAGGGERVICFGHGHALRALALTWLGLDLAHGEVFPLETATVSVLGDYHGNRALLGWNLGWSPW